MYPMKDIRDTMLPMTLLVDFVFITQNLVILTSSIITEIDIPSDHPFLYFELRLDNTSVSAIEILTKLYYKANWNNINYIIYKNR